MADSNNVLEKISLLSDNDGYRVQHVSRVISNPTPRSYELGVLARIDQATSKEYMDVRVTPDFAQQLLLLNTNNRNISGVSVQKTARAMVRGNWMDNGETIKFSTEGKLLDGQHRLMAVIESDREVTLTFCIGLPPEVQSTLDSGRKRTVGDQLMIDGYPYATNAGAAVRWIYFIATGEANYAVDTVSTKKFLLQHPGLVDSLKFVCSNNQFRLSASLLSAIHYIATEYQGCGELANRFVQFLRDGLNSPYADMSNDPAYKLRERYLKMRNVRPDRHEALTDIIYTWNAYRIGKSISKFCPTKGQTITGFKPEVLNLDLVDLKPKVKKKAKAPQKRTSRKAAAEPALA